MTLGAHFRQLVPPPLAVEARYDRAGTRTDSLHRKRRRRPGDTTNNHTQARASPYHEHELPLLPLQGQTRRVAAHLIRRYHARYSPAITSSGKVTCKETSTGPW
ncbi:MAG: hypothetical protein AMXMBFR61_14370 [Fimbriimonadales bacterium]